MGSQIDFGYPWWLSYGHLMVLAMAVALGLLGQIRKWSRVVMILIGAVTLWSAASFVIVRFALNVNDRMALPTEKFLASGSGRILDMGAGTGRSTLMVLESRLKTSVVALDLFSESYKEHFGAAVSGQEKLLENLRAAGVEQRAAVQTGDMRKLSFEAAAFDGIVSSYAIDHLNREGVRAALGEAARVLKPGGEFLLMVIAKDAWLQFTFGPLMLHNSTRGPQWWASRLQEAGFQIVEQGSLPATLYILARK
jgi:ubiquinone/menaquinone biosynthesis C-methylase UbiE